MSDELVQWFGEQLAEDERIARAACWDEQSDVWTARPPQASYEQYTVGDYLGDGVVIVRPENADDDGVGRHVAEWDPARALREIDAKRAVLTAYAEVAENYGRDDVEYADGWVSALRFAVRQLATAYSNRPGYLDEWRP